MRDFGRISVVLRRSVLVPVAALVAALPFTTAPARSEEFAGAQWLQLAQAADLPIYDIHFHPTPFMTPEELRLHMDRHNIQRQGGASAAGTPERPGVVRDKEFKSALQDRYILATGMVQMIVIQRKGGLEAFDDTNHPVTANALQQIESSLRDHGARMIGEIHVNSANFAPQPVRRRLPADGPMVKALWDLAAKYDVPLMIHFEFDPEGIQQVDRLLASSDPKVRLILAHCGSFARAAQIRPFMERYANFACDLSFRSPPQVRGLNARDRSVFDDGGIKTDWRELIEAFPDRFAVGVDDVYDWDAYDAVATTIRQNLLGHLKPATARKLAFENARSWLKLD